MSPRWSFGHPEPLYDAARVARTPVLGEFYRRDILEDGRAVGVMNYDKPSAGEVHVGWVEAFGEGGPGSGTGIRALGTAAMRQLGAQLKAEGVHTVSGDRVSGARHAETAGRRTKGEMNVVKVSLVGGPNTIQGRETGGRGDQPRVPAGESNGGQWTRG